MNINHKNHRQIIIYKRMLLVIIICITIIFTIASIFYSFTQNNQVVSHANDLATTRTIKEKVSHTKLNIEYPFYNIESLDTYIQQEINNIIDPIIDISTIKKINIHYTTSLEFNQYITLSLIINQDDETTHRYITYDQDNEKILTVENLFRGDYTNYITQKDSNFILNPQSDNLTLDHTNFYLCSNNQLLTLSMEEMKPYTLLNNVNIPSNYPHDIIIPETQTVDPNKPMIAFTFDDGPHPTNTSKLVDIFTQYNGKATFFVLGYRAQRYSDIIKNCYQNGFQIENHSWSHPNLTTISPEQVYQEIYTTNDLIFSLIGKDPHYLRPPEGAYNDQVKEIAKMNIELWNIDTLDWKYRDAKRVTDQIVSKAKDGKIILLHDIHDTSIEGVKNALPILHEQGYQFVTIDTLHQYR